ncbi:MAG: UDP-N-acetyl-D-mannosamine transferase [Cyclobacteriaceae bacterium]|nr:MAG: UDP-N-acetyl-D-mannosamine transferase [Cyclobacteriaceae bacterium]
MRQVILNCPIDNLSMTETTEVVSEAISDRRQLHHVVVNAAKIVNMQRDHELNEAVRACDIINADGQSVIWASRLLRKPLKERVAGVDLMQRLVELSYRNNYKIYFFGAKEEVVQAVVDKYCNQYSKEIIAGYRNGYFKQEEEKEIANSIANSGANILFVAISSPKKEIFLNKNKHILSSVNFIMGVGGSFDVVAGKVKRAPLWMQKIGLEWLYRLLQEPTRLWKRYLVTNSWFIWLVIKEKLRMIISRN